MKHLLENQNQTKQLINQREANARLVLRDMPEAERLVAGSAILEARMAIDKMIQTTIDAKNDQRLSDGYREELIDQAREEFVSSVVRNQERAQKIADDAEALVDSVTKPEVDPMLQQARFAEIRQRLAGMSETDVRSKYQADVADGKYSELVQALEDDPMPPSFVTEASRQASRLNRVRSVDPEIIQRYEAGIKGARVARQFTESIATLLSGGQGAGFMSFG